MKMTFQPKKRSRAKVHVDRPNINSKKQHKNQHTSGKKGKYPVFF